MSDNKQTIRATIKTIEHVTIVTIETIEHVTIEIVRTTANTVSELVHLIADALPPPQQYGAQSYHIDYDVDDAGTSSVDADLVNEIRIYLNDAEQLSIEDSIQMHTSDEETVTTENSVPEGDVAENILIEHDSSNRDESSEEGSAVADSGLVRKAVNIALRESALQAAKAHAEENLRNEVGGVLLGDLYISKKGERVTLVTGIVRANKARQMPASLNFTLEAWADVWRLIDGDDEYGTDDTPWKVVGWYHTHPNFGIFFSGADHTVHDPHFTHPCHVALVIDPRRKEYGFFAKASATTPAERCNEDEHCDVLADDDLAAWWKRYTTRASALPKVEIPSGDDVSQ